MKFTTLLLFLFLAATSIARGAPQEKMVTGTVTDAATGEPLTGVNVLIEGTLTGVSTDLSGKYSLTKTADGAIIAFSFIGYTTEKITYTGQSVIDVKLFQAVMELDQVVVIGYGTIKKSDLTGSVASVSSKEIEKVSPVNIQSALQGQVAGMMITANSGAPGSEATVRVRGIGTVNNNNPIYVIDGMLIDPGQVNDPTNIRFLNPWDIESIEVLKDASAQAIYGSRGANGVILITTKKGTEGLPKITFSSTIGFSNVTRVPKVLDPLNFKILVLVSHYNGYMRSHPDANPHLNADTLDVTTRTAVNEYNNGNYTNWLDELLRKNVVNQNYNLSITGGTKYSHYSASAGYLNTDGLIKNFNYKRYAFRLNTDYKAGKHITIGENLGVTTDRKKGYENYGGSLADAMAADPLSPMLKPEGTVDVTDPDYGYNKYYASPITFGNPVLGAELLNLNKSMLTLVGNMFAEAQILKDFKFRSSWGFNLAYYDESQFSPKYNLSPENKNEVTTVSDYNSHTNGWVWENTLTYNKTTKNQSITVLLGYTSEYTKAIHNFASKQGTPNNDPELQTFDAATSEPNVTGSYNDNSMISYLGRVNYSLLDKYLLTASVRRDGSSKFGSGHRWGIFPSFSLAWRISNEEFFKNLSGELINNFKLRAGWGRIGNSSLPAYYAYVSQVASSWPNYAWWNIENRYIFGEKLYTGYFLSTIGTPDISWETTEQTNIGLDISILKNSLSITADYFIKNTRNMLLQIPYPYYAGYPSMAAPYTNAGSVENKGFELVVDYKIKTGDFSYGISVNGSMFRNKVNSLGPGQRPIIYFANRTEVGGPIGRYYGWITDGIFQTEKEVRDYKGPGGSILQPNASAGDFRFKNLNDDDVIDSNDETWIGNPWPKLTYGVNINLAYKAIDLVLFFQGSYGNDIYDVGLERHLNFVGSGNEFEYIYKNAWRGPGTSNTAPILSTVDNNDNYRVSDFFVKDGSYLRLKNVQFGYNLPKAICDKVRITTGRIWIGGTNLLTFTKYWGIDPEVGAVATPTVEAGYDWNNNFPQSREISLGVTFSL